MNVRTLVILLLILQALTACKPTVPRGILSEGKMEEVLYDYHVAQSLGNLPNDSAAIRRYLYVESVFRKHRITEAEFDSSLVWYTRNTRRLHKIYTRMEERAKAEMQMYIRATSSDHFANLTATGDTANIWGGNNFYLLTPSGFSNRMLFTLEADSTFLPHDKFMWKFSTRFLSKEGSRKAMAGLIVHYDNDSVTGVTERVTFNNNIELVVEADSFSTIRRISGFIYFDESSANTQRLLFLEKITLIRFHQPIELPDSTMRANSQRTDSINKNSLNTASDSTKRGGERLTPDEFRESQPVERKINVVKERTYTPTQQRRTTNTRRR